MKKIPGGTNDSGKTGRFSGPDFPKRDLEVQMSDYKKGDTTGWDAREVRRAARELWLDVPGNGVLMAVPVDSIGGQTAKEYLLHQQEGESPMTEQEKTHELIVVITNQGYTDQVMDAARAAGATGGTAVHAKGTGTELAKRFFGVSIASERELIFILARVEDKKPIMKAVMDQAGMNSKAQSLVFSLPVSGLAGLRTLDTEE